MVTGTFCRGRCPHRPVRYDIRMRICSGGIIETENFCRGAFRAPAPFQSRRRKTFICGLPKAAPTAGCPRRQSTLPLVTSLTLYKRPTLLALACTNKVRLPGGIFRFVHSILRNYLRRYSACRERRPRRSAIFFRSCRGSGGLPPAACMRLSC